MPRTFFVLGFIRWFLWRFFLVRYGTMHSAITVPNYGAYALCITLGMHEYLAVCVGHVIHILIGFRADRDINFQMADATQAKVRWYWTIEVVSFASIFPVMHVVGVWLDVNDWSLFGYWDEWGEFVSRCAGGLVAGAISIFGNRGITFRE